MLNGLEVSEGSLTVAISSIEFAWTACLNPSNESEWHISVWIRNSNSKTAYIGSLDIRPDVFMNAIQREVFFANVVASAGIYMAANKGCLYSHVIGD